MDSQLFAASCTHRLPQSRLCVEPQFGCYSTVNKLGLRNWRPTLSTASRPHAAKRGVWVPSSWPVHLKVRRHSFSVAPQIAHTQRRFRLLGLSVHLCPSLRQAAESHRLLVVRRKPKLLVLDTKEPKYLCSLNRQASGPTTSRTCRPTYFAFTFL